MSKSIINQDAKHDNAQFLNNKNNNFKILENILKEDYNYYKVKQFLNSTKKTKKLLNKNSLKLSSSPTHSNKKYQINNYSNESSDEKNNTQKLNNV